jgi:hypothetical protein
MAQPVVHFEIIGKDPERLRSFYGDLSDGSSTRAARSRGGFRAHELRVRDSSRRCDRVAAASAGVPATTPTSSSMSAFPTLAPRSRRPRARWDAPMGPDQAPGRPRRRAFHGPRRQRDRRRRYGVVDDEYSIVDRATVR